MQHQQNQTEVDPSTLNIEDDFEREVLEHAKLGIPEMLSKAILDYFDYAIGLRDGTRIHFHDAELSKTEGWIRLIDITEFHARGEDCRTRDALPDRLYPRGMDVRISDIIWCADAPTGS